MIESWGLKYSPELDPALDGPITDQVLGVFVYNPYLGGAVAGAEGEAVDRTTGSSFDPPVTATASEGHEWARLTLPSGVGEVGLRITALYHEERNHQGRGNVLLFVSRTIPTEHLKNAGVSVIRVF